MKLDPRKEYEAPKYEHPVDDVNWTAGLGQPAGVYWLAGRSLIAAHDTVAEQRLLEQGAILIATLRFDAAGLETVRRTGRVERLGARAAGEAFLTSGVN
jgi:hypothetical protein